MSHIFRTIITLSFFALSQMLPNLACRAQTVYTTLNSYEAAISNLGAKNLVDFDELNASPNNGTIAGRPVFNGDFYKATKGISFASPTGVSLYIAPAGSSKPDSTVWNISNSLSVGRFPYDPAPGDDQDALNVGFNALQCAVGFTLVNATTQFAEFYDVNNTLIATISAPTDYAFNRKFYGLVSKTQLISSIKIVDNATDFGYAYDDFEFVPSSIPAGSSVPEPGVAGLVLGSIIAMSGWFLRRKRM